MKRLLISLAAVLCLASCKKDNDIKDNNSPIYINGYNSPLKAAQKMSAHDILAKTEGGVSLLFNDYDLYDGEMKEGIVGKAFDIEHLNNIDTINDRLIMEAANVIDNGQMHELGGVFLRCRNYYLCNRAENDTLGYIPNSVIRSAQKDILDLWREGDIPAIYERFNESFYFIPCTAEEFKQIKEPIDWEHEYDEIRAIHGDTHNIKW